MRWWKGFMVAAWAVGLGLGGSMAALGQAGGNSVTGAPVACTGGQAAGFSCDRVDLLSFLHYSDIGGTAHFSGPVVDVVISDLWGWTDPQSGKEYALIARTDGVAFVDVTDPVRPVYLGELPGGNGAQPTMWRDLKVYAGHVFVVAEMEDHGMQVFDLRALRTVQNPPVTFTETAHYGGISAAHNLAINEGTGYAFVLGANSGGTTCGGGLHIVDINNPATPRFVACFADPETGRTGTGYTHDAQCLLYHGPDADHQGREICIASNETAISIIDVTVKEDAFVISRATHPQLAYVHQGWLTEDYRYFLLNDELDERRGASKSLTYFWDFEDLDDPVLLTIYQGVSTSIDHNLYLKGRYAYQANYTSGFRLLDIRDINAPAEIGFFDTYPRNDAVSDPVIGVLWRGAWSTYPFFESGNVIVSSVGEGLFVLTPTALTPTANEPATVPATFQFSASHPNPFGRSTTFTLTLDRAQYVRLAVFDGVGREVARLHEGFLTAGTSHPFELDLPDLPDGVYFVRATGETTQAVQQVVLVR